MNLTPEDLAALGLSPDDLGFSDAITRADDDTSRAFAAAPLDLSAPDVGGRLMLLRWTLVPSPGAEALGLVVREAADHPGLLLIAARELRPLSVRTQPTDPAARWQDSAADSEAVVDLARCRVAAIISDGATLLLQRDASGLHICPAATRTPIQPPLERWLDALRDPWLARTLAAARAPGASEWERAAAAGTWGRLRALAQGEARTILAQLLQGTPTEEAAPWRWAATLTPPQRRTLVEAAEAEAAALLQALEALRSDEEGGPEDDAWRARLLALLHRRDVLQSVLKVLSEGQEAARSRAIPARLDAFGAALLLSLPRLPELGADLRLQRAARVEPDAWWVIPAADPAG